MVAEVSAGFAGLLRQLRDSAGLTQEELAQGARIGVNTLSDLERGLHRRCQVQTARRLATALSLSGAPEQSFIAAARGMTPAPAARAVAAAPEVRNSLPMDTAAFTGRNEELTRITAAMRGASEGGGVVTIGAIDGMPGVGKTALTVHVAHV